MTLEASQAQAEQGSEEVAPSPTTDMGEGVEHPAAAGANGVETTAQRWSEGTPLRATAPTFVPLTQACWQTRQQALRQ